jgi:hypothetical protein
MWLVVALDLFILEEKTRRRQRERSRAKELESERECAKAQASEPQSPPGLGFSSCKFDPSRYLSHPKIQEVFKFIYRTLPWETEVFQLIGGS